MIKHALLVILITASLYRAVMADAESPTGHVCQSDVDILNSPCAASHKIRFFNNDFCYLNDCDYRRHCLGDQLKQLDIDHFGKLDIGGQIRLRYHNEHGMNKGVERFKDSTDSLLLNRLRLYANYQVSDWLRFYAEGILADSYWESLTPRISEVNQGDILNLFVDLKPRGDLTLRIGRSQLKYGAQRLITAADWANSMLTFEGVVLQWRPRDWEIDAFYTNVVPPDAYRLDQADYDRNFYGLWATYHGISETTLDFYHLGFDNQNPATAANPGNSFSLQTTGARLKGSWVSLLYEIQVAYQYGDAAGFNNNQNDGFVVAGLGKEIQNCFGDAALWFYLDYASENYNQLFPLAHTHLGYMDAVQRSNVLSPNVILTASLTEKLNMIMRYYYFLSASGAPILSLGGTPTQNSNRNFGQEFDLLIKYQITPRIDFLFGYSHLWRGPKIENSSDADFIYLHWQVNF